MACEILKFKESKVKYLTAENRKWKPQKTAKH